jgi:glycine C-acetyltransferase
MEVGFVLARTLLLFTKIACVQARTLQKGTPMYSDIKQDLNNRLQQIRDSGLYKNERIITSPQQARVSVFVGDCPDFCETKMGLSPLESQSALKSQPGILNLCANNYLGLADHPDVIRAAHEALDRWGYGMASVRFICGTQQIHKELERKISLFLGTEDTILYSSCFDANGGLFETLLGPEDAVISDELNHASIIDGVRLCKARRYRYKNNNMADLEAQLKQAADARFKIIASDGVFSMDGLITNLPGICNLADKHDALVMIDDSHGVGVLGPHGRGTHEYHGVMDRVDIITGTLGKALGGASGGYTSGRKEIVELLRQRSRPYLFSNTLPPPIVCAAIKAIDIISTTTELRDRLAANTKMFRQGMADRGFHITPGEHPICPIMLGDAKLAAKMSEAMLERGVYVVGFSYPVVPEGKARIRVQISAAHAPEDLSIAMDAFSDVKKSKGI